MLCAPYYSEEKEEDGVVSHPLYHGVTSQRRAGDLAFITLENSESALKYVAFEIAGYAIVKFCLFWIPPIRSWAERNIENLEQAEEKVKTAYATLFDSFLLEVKELAHIPRARHEHRSGQLKHIWIKTDGVYGDTLNLDKISDVQNFVKNQSVHYKTLNTAREFLYKFHLKEAPPRNATMIQIVFDKTNQAFFSYNSQYITNDIKEMRRDLVAKRENVPPTELRTSTLLASYGLSMDSFFNQHS